MLALRHPSVGDLRDAEGQGEGRSGVCQGLSHLVRTLPPPPPLFPLFLGFLPQRPVFSHLSFPEAQPWGAGGPQMPIDCLVRCPSPVSWRGWGKGRKLRIGRCLPPLDLGVEAFEPTARGLAGGLGSLMRTKDLRG